MIRTDHVLTRFLATLIANVVRAGLAFLTGMLVARSLGASDYGNLNFLLASFAAINLVLDMGSSPAFYTMIAKRRRSARFFGIYLLWTIGVQFFGTLAVIALVMPRSLVERIWLGHDRPVVLLAFGATFLTSQIWAMVSQIGEAARKTIVIQVAAIVQAAAHLALIAGAAHWKYLSIPFVLWLLIAEYLVLCVAIGPILYRRSVANDITETPRDIVREFAVYCTPLVIYGVVGFIYQFADRWLLQKFGGAREQGFFSVGQQFATLSLLATTSVLNVLWKEVAEARHRGDIATADAFFGSIRHTLYFFAAWLSCMMIPYTAEILLWCVGSDFIGAQVPTALMLLFPVHQTLGQIQGTYLLSTGNTQTHSRIGILTMLISLPVTYVVLAPSGLFGFGLGATGLVVKMLLLQLLGVTLQIRALVRAGSVSYDFGYQFALLATLLVVSFACRWLVGLASGAFHIPVPAAVFLGCFLYAGLTAIALMRYPSLAGVDHRVLARHLGGAQGKPVQ